MLPKSTYVQYITNFLLIFSADFNIIVTCQETLEPTTTSLSAPMHTINDNVETVEDCNNEQFFYLPQSRCRNCSDITQLFQSYQQWLGREVSDVRKSNINNHEQGRHGVRNSNNKYNGNNDSKTNNANNEIMQFTSVLIKDNINNNTEPGFTGGDVLSRLISISTQDQEYSDSSQDTMDESGSIESADSKADLIKITKQTLKLISRFIRSSFIGNELLGAIDQCRQYQNISACQMWSNLCMVTMYSYSDIPKAAHSQSSSSHDLNKANYENDLIKQPKRTWQKCPQFDVNSICNSLRDWYRLERKPSVDIQNIYAVDEPLVKVGSNLVTYKLNQPIQLLAYKYSFNGKLIGVDQFGLSDMEKFCVILDKNMRIHQTDSNYIRVGKSVQLKCQLNSIQASLYGIKHFNETIFIDLYIAYPLNGAMFVKPVPILISNLMYNGVQVNRKHDRDSSRWKLVHRFFFHSTLVLDDGEPDGLTYLNEEILLYTRSASLEFKFKRSEKGVVINSLLLALDYGQIQRSNLNHINASSLNLTSINLESKVTIGQQLMDMQNYKKDFDLMITMLSIVSSIWSLIKCYNIQKCYGLVKLDLSSLFRFIIFGCDTMGNLFALATLMTMCYLFIALKFQTNVYVLAPSDELESVLLLNIQLAFLFKLIGLVHKLSVILDVDIFFIDWERPKMLTSSQILNHTSYYAHQVKSEQNIKKITEINSANKFANPGEQQSSFWRPYTIVNRWLQIQTLRRLNITLQLFLFVCIVSFVEITNLGTADINWSLSLAHNQQYADQKQQQLAPFESASFRLLILATVYLMLATSQILYKKYFHEPMIRNIVREFVDLCSVSNMSLFCMLYPRFGYYIHGRNANGSGDCGIAEMNALLEREERDLCSKRGLISNTDQQTFILILPRIINDHYKKLLLRDDSTSQRMFSAKQFAPNLNQLNQSNKLADNRAVRGTFNSTFSLKSSSFCSNRNIIESIVQKNKSINTFLSNFLEHIYKDIDYSIRDTRRFENLLLNIDFDDESIVATGDGPLASNHLDPRPKAATFCVDQSDSFKSLLWLGLEGDLVFIEFFALIILDLWLSQPLVITVGLIWLLHQLFKSLYVSYARNNLITKALVDEKFLFRC